MTHLGERITDYIFRELPPAEMAEAEQHLTGCDDCRQRVRQFEFTNAILKTSPDVEPPRRIVFEAEKPSRAWKWIAPLAAAAVILLALFLAPPWFIQWNDSQLTIAFRRPEPLPAATSTPTSAPAMAQPIDYDRIIREVQSSQQSWLAVEFQKRDLEQTREIQRLRAELAYMSNLQRVMWKETMVNTSSIQLLAQKTGPED